MLPSTTPGVGTTMLMRRLEREAQEASEFAKLSPAERAASKFEELMKRHPRNKFLYWTYTGGRTAKELTIWREELKTFALDLNLELMVPGNNLTHVLMKHCQTLAVSRSELMQSMPIKGRENEMAFVKVSDFYIAFEKLTRNMNRMISDVKLAKCNLQRDFGVEM